MIKYPEIYTPDKFSSIITIIPDILDETAYVEPKYDGTNITCFAGTCASRALKPLPYYFINGLRSALKNKYNALLNLSYKYQVFLELGGEKNSPAGYHKPWSGEWDYRIIDLFIGKFIKPEKVLSILDKYGLKYVGFEVRKVEYVLNNWRRILSEDYADFEGFVLKVFPEERLLKRIKNHTQRNVIMVKFKHEYSNTRLVGRKTKEKKKAEATVEVKRGRGGLLPPSEIRGAINKAHLELGEEIFNKKKAMPVIFKHVKEEARKHGNRVPPARILYKYYEEYINELRKS